MAALNTIPTRQVEVARAVITRNASGGSTLYSRRNGQNLGSVVGDLDLDYGAVIDRIIQPINSIIAFYTDTSSPTASSFINNNPDYSLFIAESSANILELPFSSIYASGNDVFGWQLNSSQRAIINAIQSGEEFNFVVGSKQTNLPTVNITILALSEYVNTEVTLTADFADPDNGSFIVLWEVSAGELSDPAVQQPILTLPSTPQTITIKASITDAYSTVTDTVKFDVIAAPTPDLLKRSYYIGLDGSDNLTAVNRVNRDAFGEGNTWTVGKDSISPFTPPVAGKTDFRLWNLDGDYSVNGNKEIKPGMPITLQLDQSNAWIGFVSEINRVQQSGLGGVHIKGFGPLSKLRRKPLSIPLQRNIRIDQAIALVLDAFNITYHLDEALTTMRFWWTEDEDAFDILRRLVFTEGLDAALYEDNKGRIIFRNRQHRILQTRSTQTQAVFHDGVALDSDIPSGGVSVYPYFGELKFQTPQQNIVNICNMEVVELEETTEKVIWTSTGNIDLQSNEIELPIVLDDPVSSAIIPSLSDGDYTLPAGTQGAPKIVLSATSGRYITMTLSSAVPITVQNLRMRGQRLIEVAKYNITNGVDNSASLAEFEERAYTVEGYPYISLEEARAICDSTVLNYQYIRPIVTIMITDININLKVFIQKVTVGDRIRIKATQDLKFDNLFHVESIKHSVKHNGALHECYLTCIFLPGEVPTSETDSSDPSGKTMIIGTGQIGTHIIGA